MSSAPEGGKRMIEATSASAIVPIERLRCPACDSTAQQTMPSYNGFAMAVCPSCSLVHTQQRQFDLEQYDDVYASMAAYQDMLAAARKTADGEYGFRELWWYKRMGLRWLEAAKPRNGRRRLFDVGCGPGTFLLVAREWGWEVGGAEPTREPAELAQSYQLDVHHGLVEQLAPTRQGEYDAITCFEVLEHVSRPAEMLSAMRGMLNPDGLMLLSVPNLDDPYCLKQNIGPAMPPVHINFFNRRSFAAVLKRAGMEVVRFKSLPIPTSSVRNIHGRRGFLLRVPLLVLRRLIGRADGTTLIALCRRS
jgi:2-polyprenyl-3-methyl-5-hydroxy-6-metoxy-1,4-benzoquinol methylase